MKKKLLFSLICIFSTIGLNAQIIHVPADYPTIYQGIIAASDGDTVLVDTGIYHENLNFNGRKILVASHFLISHDTSDILKTVIDGNQMGSVVTFNQGEDSTSILDGFTITNGLANMGAGIYCDSSSPLVRNVIVQENQANMYAAGIYCFESDLKLLNSLIANNVAQTAGGGISCFYSHPVFENTIIRNNHSLLVGGIEFEYCDAVMVNSLVTGNTSEYCGGLFVDNWSFLKMVNSTIADNTALSYFAGGILLQSSDAELTNVIMWNNQPKEIYFGTDTAGSVMISYSDIRGGKDSINTSPWDTVHWLEGNMVENPLFIKSGADPYALSDGSPCIDTGIPDTAGLGLPRGDISGNYRVWDGDGNGNARIDMGAYEYGSVPVSIKSREHIAESAGRCYPNPFSSFVVIEYEFFEPSSISLSIFNSFGIEVFFQGNEIKSSGKHQVIWNAEGLPSGIYFYRLTMIPASAGNAGKIEYPEGEVITGKMLLIH